MRYELNGNWYTIKELSEISGIKCHTIRDRVRRGYSIEEAIKVAPTNEGVKEFCEASYWGDWVGMPISDLYGVYWKWCLSNGFTPLQIRGFSRQLFKMYPNLKTVPTAVQDGRYYRIIREK